MDQGEFRAGLLRDNLDDGTAAVRREVLLQADLPQQIEIARIAPQVVILRTDLKHKYRHTPFSIGAFQISKSLIALLVDFVVQEQFPA